MPNLIHYLKTSNPFVFPILKINFTGRKGTKVFLQRKKRNNQGNELNNLRIRNRCLTDKLHHIYTHSKSEFILWHINRCRSTIGKARIIFILCGEQGLLL